MPHTLRLLGTLELNDSSGASCSDVLSQPKRTAVLAYLAAALPFGFHRRDKLFALFWPDSDQSAARRSLNQSVHFLRRTLGAGCLPSRGADEIGLAVTTIECDTVAFTTALEREQWAQALEIYRGDLLDGFFVSDLPEFERWLEEARVAYRDAAVRAAWALSRSSFARGDTGEAKRWARWAAAKTPYDESSFRRYLEILGQAGDRATAVQAYAEFASRLEGELGIAPSRETASLAEAMRDTTPEPVSPADRPPVVWADTAATVDSGGAGSRDAGRTPRVRTVAHTVSATRVVLAAELWNHIALTGAAAAVIFGVAYLTVLQFGLPTWSLVGAATLAMAGWLVLVAAALAERRRPTAVMSRVVPGGVSDWLNRRHAIWAGVVAWLALGLATAGHQTLRALGIGPAATLLTKGVLEGRDEILVAGFDNRTDDSLLGHAMTEAIRIDLSQSRALRLVDPDRIASTLRLMSAVPASILDAHVARDVAQRLGVKAIVRGDITPVGSGYTLSISLLSTADGSVLWADRTQAVTDDALIPAIGELSRNARAEIGESLKDVRTSPPLENVTTTSIEALKTFSEARRIVHFGNQRDAIPLFARATALDPNFAVAYMQIARILANTGGSLTQQSATIDKAFQLRAHATEIERIWIESMYFALTGDAEQALASWRLLNRLQPEVWTWWNNIGFRVGANLRARWPDHDEGLAYLNRAFEICQCAFPLGNLTTAFLVAGLPDSAQNVIDLYSDRFPDMGGGVWQRLRGARAYALGDLSLALHELGVDGQHFRDRSAVLAVQGRIAESREVFQQWGRVRGLDGPAAMYLGRLAHQETLEVALGRSPEDAVGRVEDALRLFPIDSIEPLDRPYLSVAEFFLRAGHVDRAAGLMDEFEAAVEPRWRRVNRWRHLLVRGLIEQEYRGSASALPTLERAVQAAHAYLAPVPDFGFALDRVGATDSAMAVYQRFIGPSPRYAAWGFDSMWRAAVLKRLGELHEERGDRQLALDYYHQFIELWRDADAELQPQVDDVKRRISRLAAEAASPSRG